MMGQEKIQTKTPAPEGVFGRASGEGAPNLALKFPDNVKLENFLNLFQGQKERNEWRGEEFPLDAWVDWTSNTVKLYVSNPASVFAEIAFKIWVDQAKKMGGN
jgi:hypothetical protein